MLRVGWWLLLAYACTVAIAKGWVALGLPYPGDIGAGLIFYGVLYAVVAYFVRRHSGEPWRELVPLRGMAPRLSIPVLLGSLGTVVLSYEAVTFCIAINVLPKEALDVARGSGAAPSSVSAAPSLFSAIVATAVLPPLFEEALMRGLVLQALATVMSKRRAVVVSALYFAVMHGAIERTPGTFLVGLLYGWLFVRTGSLIPGMLAHALHNGAILALDWTHTLPGERGSPFLVDRYGLLPAWLVWVAVACLVAGVLLVPKTRLWPEDKGWKPPDQVEDESERLAA
jgi:membrane protease YdiL (CAAX protease family)